MTSEELPKLLQPNHNIGRALATFEFDSPVSSRRGSRSALSSPRSSRPASPRSEIATPTTDASISTLRIQSPSHEAPPRHQILGLKIQSEELPLVICFRGSGDSCRRSWLPLAQALSENYRVLLYERPSKITPAESTAELITYLDKEGLHGPYVLVAHSHGGAYARCFLHERPKDVAGMVLVETGQEATWDEKIQDEQEDDHILGNRPLVVVKGNSLLHKWRQLDDREKRLKDKATHGEVASEGEKASLMITRNEMGKWEKEDTKLKKRQLRLSKRHRFVNLLDVGHHVVRDKPERVAEEVEWVMANLAGADKSGRSSRSSSRRPSVEMDRERQSSVSSWLRKASLALTPKAEKEKRTASSR